MKALGTEIYGPAETAFTQFPDYSEEQLEMLLDWTRRGRQWTEGRIAYVQALPPRRKHEKRMRSR